MVYGNRSEADYEDFKDFNLEEVREIYPKFCEFVGVIGERIVG